MTALNESVGQTRTSTARPTAPRILLATAGDEDSIGALYVAAALAREGAAEVLALGVAAPFPHTMSTLISPKSPVSIDEDSRLRMLEDVRLRLEELPGTERWTKRAIVGWPVDVINAAAASWKASLIVIGIGRHGRMDRLFGSETAVGVIKHAHIPVLAVSSAARDLPRHACAAVDFTDASLSAAALAADLLADDGTLTLVHACAFKGVKAHEGDLVDVYRAGARAKLDESVEKVKRHTQRRVEGAMLEGEPGETLLEYARHNHCDLIALGGHEQGLVDRILIGSVRTRVLRGAECSVLVAPPAVER
jgi:nucleotide-binding universal stress UspA family protein